MYNTLLFKVLRLFLGLFLFGVAVTLMIKSNLGLAPWDVFHQGLSMKLDITFGKASIIVGFILVVINAMLGEKMGWGTLSNMYFIGIFIDIVLPLDVIPHGNSLLAGIVMLTAGMFLIGFGSYFYMSAGLGSRPRDGLMVALIKRFDKSIFTIRSLIEVGVLIIGLSLGGSVGIGTLYIVLTIGFFVQTAYKICRFNVKELTHRVIDEDIIWLKRKFIEN